MKQPVKPKNDVGMGSKLGYTQVVGFHLVRSTTLCSFPIVAECQVARLKAEVERLKAGLGWQLG